MARSLRQHADNAWGLVRDRRLHKTFIERQQRTAAKGDDNRFLSLNAC